MSTDTKAQPDEQAVEPVDNIPLELRSWGMSGRPLRMALDAWQPAIAALREVNTGAMDVADAQPVLDATFPDADYQAADLTLPNPPKGTFGVGDVSTVDVGFIATDLAIGLPVEHFTWDFGDGSRGYGPAAAHTYPSNGRYTVGLTVAAAGEPWSSRQTIDVAGGPLPRVAVLVPRQVTVGGTRKITVRVAGTDFDDSTVIVMDGADVATTFISENELTTLVDPKTAVLGTVPVAVRQGGRLSNSLGFDFVPGGSVASAAGLSATAAVADFDPAEHTVDDVLAYADENPDQVDSLIGQEEHGKARVTLLEKLHAMNDD